MATYVYDDANVVVNSVDLSDHVESAEVSVSADTPEDTAMGDTFRSRLVGLLDSSVNINFRQDFAASEVDATLWAVFIGRAAVTVSVRPTSSATASTNPDFNGSMVLQDYTPLTGSVGDVADSPVTFVGAGTLSRSTS